MKLIYIFLISILFISNLFSIYSTWQTLPIDLQRKVVEHFLFSASKKDVYNFVNSNKQNKKLFYDYLVKNPVNYIHWKLLNKCISVKKLGIKQNLQLTPNIIVSNKNILAVSYKENLINIFDIESQELISAFKTDMPVNNLAISGNILVASNKNGQINVWNMNFNSHKLLSNGNSEEIETLDLSKDGNYLIAKNSSKIVIWDLKTGCSDYTITRKVIDTDYSFINSNFVSIFKYNGSVDIYSLQEKSLFKKFNYNSYVIFNNKQLFIGINKKIIGWELELFLDIYDSSDMSLLKSVKISLDLKHNFKNYRAPTEIADTKVKIIENSKNSFLYINYLYNIYYDSSFCGLILIRDMHKTVSAGAIWDFEQECFFSNPSLDYSKMEARVFAGNMLISTYDDYLDLADHNYPSTLEYGGVANHTTDICLFKMHELKKKKLYLDPGYYYKFISFNDENLLLALYNDSLRFGANNKYHVQLFDLEKNMIFYDKIIIGYPQDAKIDERQETILIVNKFYKSSDLLDFELEIFTINISEALKSINNFKSPNLILKDNNYLKNFLSQIFRC